MPEAIPPILGNAKSVSPAGAGSDPPAAEGLNSIALVYNRGCELSIEKWEKDQAAAKRRLKTALENCEQFKKRIKARKMTPPGTRRPVGSPADFKPPAAQPQSTEKRDEGKVLGIIDMGPWLEPAKLVAAPTPSVQEGTEPGYIGEMISMDLRGYRLAKRDVQRAKDEYLQLGRQLVTCKAGGDVNDAAGEQSLGFDKLAEESLENAQQKTEDHAKQVANLLRKIPPEHLRDEDYKEALDALGDLMMLKVVDGSPGAKALAEELSKCEKLGHITFVPASPTEIIVVKTPTRSREVRTHIVKKGETLSLIAMHYYGDMHAWPKIHEANRRNPDNPIVNPHKIEPGWKLIIP